MARKQFVRGGTRRLTTWIPVEPLSVAVAAAGGALVGTLSAAALALRPFTVVRSYLEIMMISDQSAAFEQFGAAVGIAIVSDEAVAVGVSAVPTPVAQAGSDQWFLHQNMWGAQMSGTANGLGGVSRYAVDSKAMRKVDSGEDLIIVVESMAGFSGNGAQVFLTGRLLIKNN